MRTPAGGDASEAMWFDASGLSVSSPQDAAYGEIVEFLDGEPIARTYIQVITGGEDALPPIAGPEGGELSIEDQDAPKRTWDVYDPTTGRPVDTLDGLRRALATDHTLDSEWRAAVLALFAAPSIAAAPQRLRDQMAAFLESGD